MVGARIKQAVLRGAGLVVVDPRRVELAGYADVHLRGRPGSNVAVFNGLAHVLVEEGLVDEAYVAERTEGYDELRQLLREYTPAHVERLSGVPAGDLRRAARLYGRAASPPDRLRPRASPARARHGRGAHADQPGAADRRGDRGAAA